MRPQPTVIPSFFLYGEQPCAVDDHFLHIEDLDYRSRPSNWHIRPHAHGNLHHLFHIADGGGEMQADGRSLLFAAPCLLLVPAGAVHGFGFRPETVGLVLTLADSYMRELRLREAAFDSLLGVSACLAIPETEVERRLADRMAELSRELVWQAPGHRAAVEAGLMSLLVDALRLAHRELPEARAARGPQGELVARFREAIEQHFRTSLPVEGYAAVLGVSLSRLRTACLRVTGRPPSRLVQERLLLEAKRVLLYSNLSVAEAAYLLGFEDPAYFSRFFTQGAGVSPRAFRDQAATG